MCVVLYCNNLSFEPALLQSEPVRIAAGSLTVTPVEHEAKAYHPSIHSILCTRLFVEIERTESVDDGQRQSAQSDSQSCIHDSLCAVNIPPEE